jgi:hypothetical protein
MSWQVSIAKEPEVNPQAVMSPLEEFTGLTGVIESSPIGDHASSANGKIYEFTSGNPTTFNPGPAESLSSNPSQV